MVVQSVEGALSTLPLGVGSLVLDSRWPAVPGAGHMMVADKRARIAWK